MPTPRETILAALHAWLPALPSTALRGEVLPERVAEDGLCDRVEAEAPRPIDLPVEGAWSLKAVVVPVVLYVVTVDPLG